MSVCPVCCAEIIAARGDDESPILMVGSSPSEDEIELSAPFVGATIQIFKKELFKYSRIDLAATRKMLVKYHDKMKPDCDAVSMSLVMKELVGRKFVILSGADAVKAFTGLSVQNTSGLDVTDEVFEYLFFEDDLPIPEGIRFFAITSPQTVFKSLGEFRFSLTKLGEWVKENE